MLMTTMQNCEMVLHCITKTLERFRTPHRNPITIMDVEDEFASPRMTDYGNSDSQGLSEFCEISLLYSTIYILLETIEFFNSIRTSHSINKFSPEIRQVRKVRMRALNVDVPRHLLEGREHLQFTRMHLSIVGTKRVVVGEDMREPLER